MKKSIVALSIVTLTLGSAHAAIVAFEAESGTLGADFNPAVADGNALGGFYITTETDGGGTAPGTEARTVSYSVNLAAGTYDLYAKVLVEGGSATNDSFYYATAFGNTDPSTGSWGQVNGAGAWVGGTFPGTTATGYGWGKVAGFIIEVTSGGTVQWEIGARENGMRLDAFAFVSTGQSVTGTELDNAVVVPEPSSAALLGFGSLALILRRRRQ